MQECSTPLIRLFDLSPRDRMNPFDSLDPHSIIAVTGLMALMMALVLGFMRSHYPSDIQGLGYWALAPAVLLGSAVLSTVPLVLPADAQRWFAKAFALMGYLLFFIGTRRFFGKCAGWKMILPLYAVSMLGLAWFAVIHPSFNARLVILSVSITALHIAQMHLLWREGSGNFSVRVVQAVLALHTLVLLWIMALVIRQGQAGKLLDAASIETFYLVADALSVLLLAIGAVLMATERVRTELEVLATYDSLTNVLNRRAIVARCANEHVRFVRYGRPFSLMMIDLDHFKAINDSQGHQQGDKVLVHFANRTQGTLRRPDSLGRYGGEEFLVLLPSTRLEDAQRLAVRIHSTLTAGHALDCKVSIGVTMCCGVQDTIDAMLARADRALYQAKARGRNQTCAL